MVSKFSSTFYSSFWMTDCVKYTWICMRAVIVVSGLHIHLQYKLANTNETLGKCYSMWSKPVIGFCWDHEAVSHLNREDSTIRCSREKNWSHEDSKQTIMAKTGVAMKEKRITKKIANMKSQLKKKINWWNENRK